MYFFCYVSISLPTLYSCLVRKLIQKHLKPVFDTAKWTHSVDQLWHKYSPKCTVWDIKFSGSNTPESPLREGATPSHTYPQHSLRPCTGPQMVPSLIPPMLNSNLRPMFGSGHFGTELWCWTLRHWCWSVQNCHTEKLYEGTWRAHCKSDHVYVECCRRRQVPLSLFLIHTMTISSVLSKYHFT